MKNVKAGLFLLFSQIAYALLTVVWLIVALMSFMLFDSSEAWTNTPTWFLFVFVWLYPLAVAISAVVSWVLYHKRKFKAAVWTDLIPLLWVLAVGGAFFL